jgi:hypothetical protein
MWWNIIKARDIEDQLGYDNLKEIHVQEIINEVVQDMADKMGVQNLDLRFKDRLISAGITVDNDGKIPIGEFVDWLGNDIKYVQRMRPSYQHELTEELLENADILEIDNSNYTTADKKLFIQKLKEALLVIVEIEDEATSPLEYRELFGDRGEESIGRYRQLQLNRESSQRHPPVEDT